MLACTETSMNSDQHGETKNFLKSLTKHCLKAKLSMLRKSLEIRNNWTVGNIFIEPTCRY